MRTCNCKYRHNLLVKESLIHAFQESQPNMCSNQFPTQDSTAETTCPTPSQNHNLFESFKCFTSLPIRIDPWCKMQLWSINLVKLLLATKWGWQGWQTNVKKICWLNCEAGGGICSLFFRTRAWEESLELPNPGLDVNWVIASSWNLEGT
jgi:hypothetical protein